MPLSINDKVHLHHLMTTKILAAAIQGRRIGEPRMLGNGKGYSVPSVVDEGVVLPSKGSD